MTFAWKAAGLSYLKYTQICARAVRNSLKDDLRLAAQRRDEQGLKFAKWEAGKQGEFKPVDETQRSR
ncbi:hypothetical protein Glove_293g7 [Diversispora epigaea]|uniref:Uncharacterized protein n=1 Tax=Diversispora epigaea TaxID=1348612 RepID=A0A397HZY3_9GLOM|nr:hypothetical protein Glove_293g7 [Diversispora epigaea]